MKLGIVGLPNVGKSTLFNAITKAGAEAARYLQFEEDHLHHHRVPRHSRPGEGCVQRRRIGKQVPGSYPGGFGNRARGSLL